MAKALFIVLLSGIFTTTSWSQSPQSDTSYDTRKKLSIELYKKRANRAMLERILASLNNVDSAYITHFPTWIINDDDIRERVQKVFRNRLKFPSRDSSLIVITNPSKTEIEKLSMGSVSMGREEVRLFLGDNLRRTILSEDYPRASGPPIPEPKKLTLQNPEPKDVYFEASLFGGNIKFANGWGIDAQIGNDDIGYPFWSAGTADLSLFIDQIKLGLVVPIDVGNKPTNFVAPFNIPARKLNGTTGFSAQYSFPAASGTFDFHFLSSSFSNRDSNITYTSLTDAYFIRTMLQGFYSRNLGTINNEHFFTMSVGVGYHEIIRGEIQKDYSVFIADKFDYYSPIIKLNYKRSGIHTYGVELQSYSSTLMVTAWIEIVKDFIYTDLKYSLPVFRDPEPWENSYFIMLSPRIRLAF
ncbi:MAG: hypothetical protein ACHQQQ_09935 [Bacteroidota bacterium]